MKMSEELKMSNAEFRVWAYKEREKLRRFKNRAILVLSVLASLGMCYAFWNIWSN